MCKYEQPFWNDAEKGPYGQQQKRLIIPTYDPDSDVEYDYARPHELVLQDDMGLRIVMGDPVNLECPDVAIERAVDCWRLFVHIDGGDPLCIIEITNTEGRIESSFAGVPPLLVEKRATDKSTAEFPPRSRLLHLRRFQNQTWCGDESEDIQVTDDLEKFLATAPAVACPKCCHARFRHLYQAMFPERRKV